MFSLGLLTLASVCLPTSCVAAWPPLVYGMYENFTPAAFSTATVMMWSSRLVPVPPILKVPAGAALTAARKSLVVFSFASALFHSTNSSSAIIATGLSSRQLNGRLTAIGSV